MTTSMTAFARAEQRLEDWTLIWEIRSVNHRYLDINLKLPEALRWLEPKCRHAISALLDRGRVDAHLKVALFDESASAAHINHQVVKTLAGLITELDELIPGLKAAKSTDILSWPGVITQPEADTNTLAECGLSCLAGALEQLVINRRREGERMGEIISEKIARSRNIVNNLNENIEDIQQEVQSKWRDKIADVASSLDPDRIAQEVAVILTKSDIAEELDRLTTHLDEVIRLIEADHPVGRNLDFLMQELNREANTIGSKSIDGLMSNAAIELKVLVDQMREQIQNIE